MTSAIPVGAMGGRARLVPDDSYLAELEALLARARRRCLCSLFIVELAPLRDRRLAVDGLLRELAGARWRGADARLLVGGSRSNLQIAILSESARAHALRVGLPCRWLTSRPARGSHAKLVVADDAVLVGSHNWSPGAFERETQDSVLVESADLAEHLAGLFERQWASAG